MERWKLQTAENILWTDYAVLNVGILLILVVNGADRNPIMTANAVDSLSNCVVMNDCYKAYWSLVAAIYLDMLGNFAFHIVSQWNDYEERHTRWGTIIFDISLSFVVVWQTYSWLVDWASRTNAMASTKSRSFSVSSRSLGLGNIDTLPIKTKNMAWAETTNSRYNFRCSAWLNNKKYVRACARVCLWLTGYVNVCTTLKTMSKPCTIW
jgi:hypothetical protein